MRLVCHSVAVRIDSSLIAMHARIYGRMTVFVAFNKCDMIYMYEQLLMVHRL